MKKIITTLLALLMLAQTCYAIPVEVDDVPLPNFTVGEDGENRIAGTDYENIYPLLYYLGIIEESETKINPDKQLKRGEAATIIARITSNGNYTVERASKLITKSEATEIILDVMGYSALVKDMGVDKTANLLSLYKNYKATEGFTVGNLMVMIYNALTADLLQFETVSADGHCTFKKDNTKTFLSDQKEIYVLKAVVTSVYYSSLYADGIVEKNEIALNRKPYVTLNTVKSDMLGKNVTAYVDTSLEDESLIYMYEYKTKTLAISGDDFLRASTDVIEYENDDDKKQFAKVADNSKVVFNKVYYGTYATAVANDIFKQNTEFLLVDNDEDGTYDVVCANLYSQRVVNTSSATTGIITFKYDYPRIETDKNNVTFVAEFNGEEALQSDLKEWDVLSILEATSPDGEKYYYAYVSQNVENGAIEEITDDKYVINGKSYPLTQEYKDFLTKNTTETKPVLGETSYFYLSFDKKLVASSTTSSYIFAYLMGVAKEKSSGISDNIQMKVYGFDSVASVLNLEKKVTLYSGDTEYFSGKSVTAQQALDKLMTGSTPNTKLFAYKLNTKGNVTTIAMEYDGTSVQSGTVDYPIVKNEEFDGKMNEESRIYAWVVGKKYLVSSSTKVMAVMKSGDRLDEESYDVRSYSSWGGDTYMTNKNLAFYNTSGLYKPGIWIVYTDDKVATVSSVKLPYVVTKAYYGVDSDGEQVRKLDLQRGNNTTTITIDDDTKMVIEDNNKNFVNSPDNAKDITVGDIVQYESTKGNKADVIRCLFRVSKPGSYRAQNSGSDPGQYTTFGYLAITYGKVEKVDSTAMVLLIPGENGADDFYTPAFMNDYYGKAVVTIIETDGTNVTKVLPADKSDILPEDSVVVRKQYNGVCDVFIIR